MARPSWKGYLKLSLVSCPVALVPATSSRERISFHIMNRKTGNRTRYLVVDSETEEPVDSEDRVRGYQIGKNDYVYLEDEEIDDIKIESTHTIDIDRFVPRGGVDPLYLNTPYFLAPDDKIGEEAFSVIREAMRTKKMAGIARVVMMRRERMLLLEPYDKGLLATTLRNSNEVRHPESFFEHITKVDVTKEMLSIAADIIDRKSGKFDPKAFEDRYEKALADLIEAKREGHPATAVPSAPRPRPTANLMDALRRSLEGEASSRKAAQRGARRAPAVGRTAASRRRAGGKAAARRAS